MKIIYVTSKVLILAAILAEAARDFESLVSGPGPAAATFGNPAFGEVKDRGDCRKLALDAAGSRVRLSVLVVHGPAISGSQAPVLNR
jgi:hypothetical protein